jgi:hypothetical protein
MTTLIQNYEATSAAVALPLRQEAAVLTFAVYGERKIAARMKLGVLQRLQSQINALLPLQVPRSP